MCSLRAKIIKWFLVPYPRIHCFFLQLTQCFPHYYCERKLLNHVKCFTNAKITLCDGKKKKNEKASSHTVGYGP